MYGIALSLQGNFSIDTSLLDRTALSKDSAIRYVVNEPEPHHSQIREHKTAPNFAS
jgi:hypothetical protein